MLEDARVNDFELYWEQQWTENFIGTEIKFESRKNGM